MAKRDNTQLIPVSVIFGIVVLMILLANSWVSKEINEASQVSPAIELQVQPYRSPQKTVPKTEHTFYHPQSADKVTPPADRPSAKDRKTKAKKVIYESPKDKVILVQ